MCNHKQCLATKAFHLMVIFANLDVFILQNLVIASGMFHFIFYYFVFNLPLLNSFIFLVLFWWRAKYLYCCLMNMLFVFYWFEKLSCVQLCAVLVMFFYVFYTCVCGHFWFVCLDWLHSFYTLFLCAFLFYWRSE